MLNKYMIIMIIMRYTIIYYYYENNVLTIIVQIDTNVIESTDLGCFSKALVGGGVYLHILGSPTIKTL